MAEDDRSRTVDGSSPPPKPFFWLDIEVRASNRPESHDRAQLDRLTGVTTCEVTSVTPIHVGSGSFDLDAAGRPFRPFTRRRGEVVVPGSSLKGVIRSIAEALSASCLVTDPSGRCKPPKGLDSPLCTCCALFGSLSYRGRVMFTDGIAQPNVSLAIRKIPVLHTPKRPHGRKFYVHGTPAEGPVETEMAEGTFVFDLRFTDVSESELGLLYRAMGFDQSFALKLGGAKPRCYGGVRLRPVAVRLAHRDRYRRYASDEVVTDLQQHCQHMLAAYPPERCQRALEALQQYTVSIDRACPEGSY